MILAQTDWTAVEAIGAAIVAALALYSAARTYIRSRTDKIIKEARERVETEQEEKRRGEELRRLASIADAVKPALDDQTTALTNSMHKAIDAARREFREDFERINQRLSKVESTKGAIEILREWRQDVDAIVEQLRKKGE